MKTKSELGGNVESPAEMIGLGPILDVNNQRIDPIWAAEFRGFFWGEGTIAVQSHRPAGRGMIHSYSFAITASIGLRSDDAAILREFQRRLGGRLRIEPYRGQAGEDHKTITRWVSGTAENNARIARLLVSPTGLPFNKCKQLALWSRAVALKLKQGAHAGSRYSQEDRDEMVGISSELQRLRKWAG